MFLRFVFFFGLALLGLCFAKTHKDDRCPKVNNEEKPVYLTHESDCKKFYECDSGRAIELTCPGNLYFNARSNTCDFEDNVECEFAPKMRSLMARDKEDATWPAPVLDSRCPNDNAEIPTYLVDETSCNKFYECNGPWAYSFTCPDNLYFNPEINVCDFPDNVDCKIA